MNNATNKVISRWYSAGEFCEIAAAAAVALSFVMDRSRDLWFLALVLVAIAITSRMRAAKLEYRRDHARNSGYHIITDHRLKTLETVNVETDIRGVLAELKKEGAVRADVLIAHLEANLGRNRAAEKLDVILRYTDTTKPEKKSDQPKPDEINNGEAVPPTMEREAGGEFPPLTAPIEA